MIWPPEPFLQPAAGTRKHGSKPVTTAFQFYGKMHRAEDRCLDESRRELVWGYPESAAAYQEMATEMREALWFVARQMGNSTELPLGSMRKEAS